MDSKKSSVMDKVGDAVTAFLKIVFLGVGFVIVIYFAVYYLQSDANRIASDYSIPADKVVMDPKPHGCAYNDAPLGDKHCHFEKEVDVFRECEEPNCKVLSVHVSWRKVSE